MLPEFKEGDFVLISKSPSFIKEISVGDIIVFNHPIYGVLIKKTTNILPDGFLVSGNNETSLNEISLGIISPAAILGKVILHIKSKNNT